MLLLVVRFRDYQRGLISQARDILSLGRFRDLQTLRRTAYKGTMGPDQSGTSARRIILWNGYQRRGSSLFYQQSSYCVIIRQCHATFCVSIRQSVTKKSLQRDIRQCLHTLPSLIVCTQETKSTECLLSCPLPLKYCKILSYF